MTYGVRLHFVKSIPDAYARVDGFKPRAPGNIARRV
jgi:hypothetical protein